MHGFVRGIGGAVVTFPEAADGARLWLAAEDEVSRGELDENHAHFPVMTCTTCGQHYYIAFLKDFIFTGKQPGGGRGRRRKSLVAVPRRDKRRQARGAVRSPDRRERR